MKNSPVKANIQQITLKGTPIKLLANFSAGTLQVRREWHDIFKV